jgi:hypothetical protein
MDVIQGIAAVGNALAIVQTYRGIEKKLDHATLKSDMADVISSLADAKIALSDARDKLAEQAREIERLKSSFEAAQSLVVGDGDYKYPASEHGDPIGYPVCPKCEPVDGRIIQLKQQGALNNAACPVCNQSFQPVTCYLPQGSGYRTAMEKQRAERAASIARAPKLKFL